MNLEGFKTGESQSPQTEARKNIFSVEAERANPELAKLKQELSQLTNKIGAIKQLMASGTYPGKLSDLNEFITKKDLLTDQLNKHPDFSKPKIEDNFSGRDTRIDRYKTN